MSRSVMLIVVGALVLLAPFSGLPMSILTWILPLLGAIAVAIGVSYKREQLKAARPVSNEKPLESLA